MTDKDTVADADTDATNMQRNWMPYRRQRSPPHRPGPRARRYLREVIQTGTTKEDTNKEEILREKSERERERERTPLNVLKAMRPHGT